MKKATSKRERKYGKKNEDDIKTSKDSIERCTKVIVDGYTILKFDSREKAVIYIKKKHKEAEESYSPKTSYVII